MVTATMSFLSLPARSNARAVTRRASEESRPPEMPMTAVFAFVCVRRFASACACKDKMSSARSPNRALSSGTNGVRGTFRKDNSPSPQKFASIVA